MPAQIQKEVLQTSGLTLMEKNIVELGFLEARKINELGQTILTSIRNAAA
jgi:hypothetical protein